MTPSKSSLPRWAFLLLAVVVATTSTLAARDLYWTEQKFIFASDIDGGNVTEIFDGNTSTPPMDGGAVDVVVTDTHLYWTDNASNAGGGIWRAARDGSNAELFMDAPGSTENLQFLAIDEAGGKIFFSDYERGLYEANLSDGSGVVRIFSGDPGPGAYAGLALDGAEFLWLSADSDWLYRADPSWPDSWGIAQLQGGNATYGLAYDPGTEIVYYTNIDDGTLRSYNLATEEHKVLTRELQQPLGLQLSPAGTHLLIAERGKGIAAFQLDNFGYEVLVESADAHFGVAATADPADLPPGEEPGDLPYLFRADFDSDEPSGPPVIGWGSVGGPGNGTATVEVDTENDVFGMGAENQFLRVENANSFGLSGGFESSEVATLSFDYIGRANFGDGNRWLNVEIKAGGSRVHITSIRNLSPAIRGGGDPSLGGLDLAVRLDTIVNNSSGTIAYDTPGGGTAELAAGNASIWMYNYTSGEWEHLIEEYQNNYSSTPGTGIDNIIFNLDSGDPRSFDLDNVYVFEGALVGELPREADIPEPEPLPELPVVWSLAPGDAPYVGSGGRERGMAIHPDGSYLVLVHRDAPTVTRIDALTGESLGTLSTAGISGGLFILLEVAFDEDGVMYAGNLTTDTANDNFRLYRWADEGAEPELVVDAPINSGAFDGNDRRFGDCIVVLGRGEETEILLPTFNQTAWARLTPLAEPADPTNQFDIEVVSVEGDVPNTVRYIVPGPNGNFYGAGSNALYEFELDRVALTATPIGGHMLAASISPMGYSAEEGLIGGIHGDAAEFYLFDPEDATPLSRNSFPADNVIHNTPGSVVFGNGMVYALSTDSGILALELDLGPAPVSFASWIAGFGLSTGEDGPGDNPSGDGIQNLLKYALGLDPTEASRSDLPVVGQQEFTVESVTEPYLTLTFTKPDEVEDVAYSIRLSSDLVSWADEAVLEESVSNGDGTTTYTYRDTQPLAASARRFMNLEILLQY